MPKQVAIIGYGYVGKGMQKIFPEAVIYDEPLNIGTREEVNQCQLAIVCVPTPMMGEEEFKRVDVSIVEDVVSWLETPLILIKSTIEPGTTDRLVAQFNKKIGFSPEYMGEGKYQITPWRYMSPTDPTTHEFMIVGGEAKTCDEIMNIFVKKLGPEKTYYIVTAVESEIIKYMENSWGGLKVIFANEFYQLCQKLGASYHRVREGWALDNRVERMHTAVFVDNQGFAGKCYPKDLNAIVAFGDRVGAEMSLIKAVLRKNNSLKQ